MIWVIFLFYDIVVKKEDVLIEGNHRFAISLAYDDGQLDVLGCVRLMNIIEKRNDYM